MSVCIICSWLGVHVSVWYVHLKALAMLAITQPSLSFVNFCVTELASNKADPNEE